MKDIIIVGGGYAGIAIKGYLKSKYIKIYEASNKIEGTLKDCQVSNDFFSVKLVKNLARNRSLRYFFNTVRDYVLINYYRKKNNIDNLIFTNFLAYDRDDKVKSIVRELKKLTKYEKKFIQ